MKKKEKLKLKKDVNHDIRLCKKYIQVLKANHCNRALRLEYQNLVSMEIYLEHLSKRSW